MRIKWIFSRATGSAPVLFCLLCVSFLISDAGPLFSATLADSLPVVELCNASLYEEATIRVPQGVEVAADSELVIHFIQGDLPAGLNWLFVTNLLGERNPVGYPVYVSPPTMPVELVFFRASVQEGKVLLEWRTASEKNCYGFEVQRRANKEAEFETLTFVKGSGTASTPHSYRYTDQIQREGDYYYRLKQIDTDGRFAFSQIQEIKILPVKFRISPSYPNPFTAETAFEITLAKEARCSVKVVDVLGREVKQIFKGKMPPGRHLLQWDGKDLSGRRAASGVYFISIQTDQSRRGIKVILKR